MTHDYYMKYALREAQQALEAEEVPIGAIIVMKDKIIARGFNQVEKLNDSTAHAEIIALTSAFNFLGAKYLPEATLYVTIEPCLMCAGAVYWSKLTTIVYGADDDKNGYNKWLPHTHPFHPKATIIKGIEKEACTALMKNFFQARR